MTLGFVGDSQQTGLKGSEGMSEDVRAFEGPSLGGVGLLEVHSQRQLVFCQSFSLRVVF
jgi:hypothetical protein